MKEVRTTVPAARGNVGRGLLKKGLRAIEVCVYAGGSMSQECVAGHQYLQALFVEVDCAALEFKSSSSDGSCC